MDVDLAELVRLYGDKPLDPRELTGPQFQYAVFVRMFRRTSFHGPVRNEPQGEVDFVLVEMLPPPYGEQRHLYECKNYGRPLEFDDAAKLMMIALRRPAASLNLVSSTPLQPQAVDYAHFFFPFENEVLRERKLGGSTIFRHFVTRDLIGFDPVVYERTSTRPSSDIVACELVELRPYSEQAIKILEQTDAISISPRYYYRIEIAVSRRGRSDDRRLQLVDPDETIVILEQDSTFVRASKTLHLTALFRVKAELQHREVRLGVFIRKGTQTIPRLLLPPLHVEHETGEKDLRPDESRRFERVFSDSRAWRIAIVTGEAGTGKTFVSDSFAAMKRAYSRWDVIQFDVPEHGGDQMLRELAVSLLIPPRVPTHSLSSLRKLAGEVYETISGPTGGRGHNDPVEPTELAAQVAVGLGPRLIMIRNLERIDERLANSLMRFIRALARRGWGDVHLLLEGRSGRDRDHWTSLRRDLQRSFDNVVPIHLEPMDRDAVSLALNDLFEEIPDEFVEVCWRRAGGYPLYLKNLLKFLEHEGAIQRVGELYRIVSPSIFVADVLLGISPSADKPIVGGRSDAILIARITAASLVRLPLHAPFDDPHFVLGLYALAETPPRAEVLTKMLQLGDARIDLECSLLREGLLDEEAPPAAIRFPHDLLREAAIVVAQQRSDGDAVETLAAALPAGADITDPVELELLGDLRNFTGQKILARLHYQRAIVEASRREAFVDVCRLALKQRRLNQGLKNKTGAEFVQNLETLLERAWAEWNCGSVLTAQDTYQTIVRSAGRASRIGIDSTVMRSILSIARSRLVGVHLALFDIDAFISSARSALTEYGDVASYNSVMNRLVLCCAELSLPHLGIRFLEGATRHVAHREDSVQREIDGEAVICADAARLFIYSAPEVAERLFQEEFDRSRRARQRLHAKIDQFAAKLLVSRTTNLAEFDNLRDEALGLGLYEFLTWLYELRAAKSILNGHLEEATIYSGLVRARTAVQNIGGEGLGFCNNALLLALRTGETAEARIWTTRLVEQVRLILDTRDRALDALSLELPRLAAHRSASLEREYGSSNLTLPIPPEDPPFSGSLSVAWLNLRRLASTGDGDIAAIAKSISDRVLRAFDVSAAETAFDARTTQCGITYRDIRLGLCIE